MPSYYDSHHPNVYESPKICCCIPIKLIVLAIQAAALIWQIYLICCGIERSPSDKGALFLQFLAALYTSFTFVVFLMNHRVLMCIHFCFGICLMMVPLGSFVFYSFFLILQWVLGEIDNVGADTIAILFASGIVFLVLFTYNVMCKVLIDSLNHFPLLPEYTNSQNTQQPGHIGGGPSEGSQLIYTVYPQL